MSRGIHIVGSVPLGSASEVFETLSAKLGQSLRSIPDGETGPRLDWLPWLEPIFASHPDFRPSGEEFRVHLGATAFRRYTLKPGVDAQSVRFGSLPHSAFALASWKQFERLKRSGTIPAHLRYQCDIASISSVLAAFVEEDLHRALEPALEQALIGEIGTICSAIPHGELAIQFDIASSVFFHLETGQPSRFGGTREAMMQSFVPMHARLGQAVPPQVHLIFHLCYGDNRHRHSVEPADMSQLVEFANRLSAGIDRSIELIHMPVPRGRSDDAYFRPLQRLALHAETALALGLVHYTDGVEGTRRRIAAAEHYVSDFLIGTECGFGRRAPETLTALLDIHAQAAA